MCSSDLSHFYNANQAYKLDKEIIDDIAALSAEKLNEDITSQKGEACGFGPILTGMLTADKLGFRESKILAYGTSGDINKDYSQVVGYVSAAIYKN